MKTINLEIKKGKKIAIMGKSGSGKSTLLHLITGLLNPSKGNIFFNGKNIQILKITGILKYHMFHRTFFYLIRQF